MHCCQHAPCCIASSQPGVDERSSQRSSRTGDSNRCRTAAASRATRPAYSCEQLRPAQVIAGVRKPGLQSHTPISPALHRAELYAHCLPRSSLALQHRLPAIWEVEDDTRARQKRVGEKRKKRKTLQRTTCVISMISVTFLLGHRSISLPGGVSKVEDLAAGERKPLFPPPK